MSEEKNITATDETTQTEPVVEEVSSAAENNPENYPENSADTEPESVVEDTTIDISEVKTDTETEKEKIIKSLRPGMTVRVYQKIRETNSKGETKERLQMYEGMILAIKHGREVGSTMTVRKISGGVGVEKIFPIFSPNVAKIEPVKQAKVRQSKLYYLRDNRTRKKLKETKI